MNEREQEEYDKLYALLRTMERDALASHLAITLVFSLFSRKTKAEIINEMKQNTAIIRKNRKVAELKTKFKRYEVLAKKKKLTLDERKEFGRLVKYLETAHKWVEKEGKADDQPEAQQ